MTKKWGMANEDQQSSEEYKEVQPSTPLADILSTSGSIRSMDNIIYFYAEVSNTSCCEVNRLLREIDAKLQQAKHVINTPNFEPVIHLRINSYGGDLLAAMSTIDTIRSLKSDVYTYVEGAAASAATLISIIGKKRFIGKHSLMLIHQLSSICSGTFEQLQDEHENNKRLMNIIKRLYKQYTKLPMKEIDEILKRDLWIESEVCLSHGLVDEVV